LLHAASQTHGAPAKPGWQVRIVARIFHFRNSSCGSRLQQAMRTG
jgi:hypothetical protein